MKKWLLFVVALAAAVVYVAFFAQSQPESVLETTNGDAGGSSPVQDASNRKAEPRPLPDLNPLKRQATPVVSQDTASQDAAIDAVPTERLRQKMEAYEQQIDTLIAQLNENLDSAEERSQAEAELQVLSGEYKALALALTKRALADESADADE